MPFLTAEEERRVLAAMGVQSLEDLLAPIPPRMRENIALNFDLGEGENGAAPMGEPELTRWFHGFTARLKHPLGFAGGGTYHGLVPALVDEVAAREIPFTPSLHYELSSLIASLCGTESATLVAVDGAAALSEAVFLARGLSEGKPPSVLVAGSLSPTVRSTLRTYLAAHTVNLIECPWDGEGRLDGEALDAIVAEHRPSIAVVGYPSYFGTLDKLPAVKKQLPPGTVLIAAVSDPSVLSLFEAPGNLAADMIVGNLQPLGSPPSFGDPAGAFIAGPKAWIVSLSSTPLGSSCGTRVLAYLGLVGTEGFRQLGVHNHSLFQYLVEELEGVGIPLKFRRGLHYREGVFEVPNLVTRFQRAIQRGVLPGIPLHGRFPLNDPKPHGDFSNCLLVCCHELHTRSELDLLVEVLSHD